MRRIVPILGYLLLITAGAMSATILASVVSPRSMPAAYAWLVKAVLVMIFVTAITALYLRHAGLQWIDFGVHAPALASRVSLGFALGLLLGLAWAGTVYLIAPYKLQWNSHWVPAHLLAGTLGTVAMGVAEEVGYRSYALRELRVRSGYWSAVLIPTAIFIAAHYAGGVPWQAAILVVGSTSVLFSVVMLELRSLPLVISMHAATNLVQDNLLRPSLDASLFALSTPSAPGEGTVFVIWSAMLAVNIFAAGVLIWTRRRE